MLIETFQDDANHDPQWSEEQILAAGITLADVTIGAVELDILSKTTMAVFEILERAWATQDCTLIDMKIEFGVDISSSQSAFLSQSLLPYINTSKKRFCWPFFRFSFAMVLHMIGNLANTCIRF